MTGPLFHARFRPMDISEASAFEQILSGHTLSFIPTQGKRPHVKWKDLPPGESVPASETSDGFALILRETGLVVLDVDVPGGWDSLDAIQGDHEFPDTLTVRTTSGGRHYYFTTPATFKDSIGFAPSLDFKAYGYVIIPGSNGYTITNQAPPAPLPDWLHPTRTNTLPAHPAVPPPTNTAAHTLQDLSTTAKGRQGLPWHFLRNVAQGGLPARVKGGTTGEDLGPVDALMFQAMMALAEAWPTADPAQVAQDVFLPSQLALAAQDQAHGNPAYSLEDWQEKFSRALSQTRARDAALQPTARALMANATPDHPPTKSLYTHQSNGMCYVADAQEGRIRTTCRQVLPTVLQEEGFQVSYTNDKGKTVWMQPSELLRAYSADAVAGVTRDLTITETTLSPSRILHVPTAQRPEITPKRHPEIERWLELMIPDPHDRARIYDWVGTASDLTTSQPAVWLTGAAKTGKTLFARAMATLWGLPKPTTGEDALSRFNYQIGDCPVIHFDEDFPRDWRGNPRIQDFKNLVDDYAHSVEQKFMPAETINGSVRVVLTSNHFGLVTKAADLQSDDVHAIQRRIIHVDVTDAAKAYLEHQPVQAWMVPSGKIAQHFRHLEETYKTSSKLPGHCPTIARKLRTDTNEAYPVLIAMVEWLKKVDPKTAPPDTWDGLAVCDGVLYVTPRRLMSLIQASDQIPYPVTRQRIRAALGSLGEQVQKRIGGNPRRCTQINMDHFLEWAEKEDDGRDEIQALLDGWTNT